ncbi:MAG: TonB-dependent receptor, partial [Variovorax sp.]|nr:TonB-dependent receptor [Variovorax sp.]
WLTLRGSYATGLQPPTPNLLIPSETEYDRAFQPDPKRGNDFFVDEGTYLERQAGNPDLKAIEASTLSLGMVLNPFGDRAPRVSFDYSRIITHGEPFAPLSVLEHEDIWPERVIREPLTEEDRALGYTAGRILVIDSSVANAGRSTIETLDALLDWRVPVFGGTLRTYGAATWQIGNTLTEPAAPAQQRVGFARSPVEWRANAGFDFTRGPLALGANLQYVGRYRAYQYDTEILAPDFIAVQGSAWVAAQVYLDLYASRRFRVAGTEASVDLGIVNVFDQAPAFEADPYSTGHGYSMYGDPRRRRLEVVLSAEF